MANLDSFERVTCRYIITAGYAKSLDDALAGRFIPEKSEVGKGLWLKRGRNSVVRFEEDPSTTKRLNNPKLAPMPGHPGLLLGPGYRFETTQYLTNGTQSLSYSRRSAYAHIALDESKHRFRETPFEALWYGDSDHPLPELARQVELGQLKAAVKEETINGRILTALHFSSTSGFQSMIWIDSERGFLPARRRYQESGGVEVMRADISEVRDCGNGRWFPMKSLYIQPKSEPPPWIPLYECKVTELDTETLPDKSEFAVELPPGTTIMNHDDSRECFRTRRPERVHADDLEHVLKMAKEAPTNPLMDTAINPPGRWRWAWWAVGGTAAVLLLVGIVLYLRRLGRVVPSPPPPVLP